MGQFKTFQTVQRYEEALSRHAQYIRWLQGITCPCSRPDTGQPDPQCSVCKGRGKIYSSPEGFSILNTIAKHDNSGKVFPPVGKIISGSAVVVRKDVELPLSAVQPSDGSYVQLEAPYPKQYEVLSISYSASMDEEITGENSDVIGVNTLRTVTTRFTKNGKTFEGSLKSVSRVYNVTKDETYAVSSAIKEYIYLSDMGTWSSGDTLEVDYVYVKPFSFMLVGITPRLRYEQAYLLEEADAILVTPYWAVPSTDDIFTALSQEQIGKVIVTPSIGGMDEITAYYDLSKLLMVVDRNNVRYTTGPGKDVEIYGRNELKWNVSKPTVPYTAQFTFHPTVTALTAMPTMRNSENKSFVNRTNVRMMDRMHEKVVY